MQTQSNDRHRAAEEQFPHQSSFVVVAILVATAVLLVLAVLIRLPGQIIDGLPLAQWSAVAPFGTVEIAAVHVLSGFPVSWCLAKCLSAIATSDAEKSKRTRVMLLALVGGLIAVVTLYFGDTNGLHGVSSGVRFWLRLLWVIGLQLPWCLAATILLNRVDSPSVGDQSLTMLGVVVLAAILLPMAHYGHAARREAQAVADFSAKEQSMHAWRHLVTLESFAGTQEIGGQVPTDSLFRIRPVGGLSSDLVRRSLVEQLHAQILTSSQALPVDAGVSEVMQHASILLSLNALDDAVELLSRLAERRPDALLLLATLYEEKHDYGKAVEILEEATGLIGEARGDDVERVVRSIYQRLAQNLRRQQRYREAEQRLLEAVDRYDHSDGFFYFELGQHCEQGGRFNAALRYYQRCVRADDRYATRVEGAIRHLRVETPACVLSPTRNSPP